MLFIMDFQIVLWISWLSRIPPLTWRPPPLFIPSLSVFFEEKTDKTLRPCIDYLGLNDIMVKNRYPLLLISSGFKLLHGSTIFTKQDLWNTYHLVCTHSADRH